MQAAENRDADILRTAEALAPIVRAKYVKDKIGPTADFFVQVLVRANASDMSSNAFRQLFTFLTYANPDGSSAFPSHETVAAIIGYSVATSERATSELKKLGWISTQRTRRGPAVRTVKIPTENMKAIAGGTFEPSPVRVPEYISKFLNPHPGGPGTLTREGLPTTLTYQVANQVGCLEGESEKAEKQLGAVAQPQVETCRRARRRRGEVRPW